MSRIKNTGNVSACPAPNSVDGTRAHVSGDDAPENRQDLVVVMLTRAEWLEVEFALAGETSQRERWQDRGAGTPRRDKLLQSAFQAIGRAMSQPPPDQGEHIAQRKEGRCSLCKPHRCDCFHMDTTPAHGCSCGRLFCPACEGRR